MSILLNRNSKLAVHGFTGAQGSFHSKQCLDYGSKIVAGITPGKGGTEHLGVPVFNTAREAVEKTGANASLIFVPPPYAADSILEAADAGIKVIICITEGIPVMDMVKVKSRLKRLNAEGKPDDSAGETAGKGIGEKSEVRRQKADCFLTSDLRPLTSKLPQPLPAVGRQASVTLVGPNCPGVITPGECKAGIMPAYIHKKGSVGVVSRSGTLTYEAVWQLTTQGLGQSTVVGIGGDPVQGMNFVDTLKLFQGDRRTKAVVMIGEIGGSAEEDAARYIKDSMTKPVFSFVAGKTAPPGRRMGHAGAIVEGGAGTHASKVAALKAAGVTVVENLSEIGAAVAAKLKNDKKIQV